MPMSLIDRATTDMLIGPDWAMNLEICDILNNDPGQIKDVVKSLKKRIGHRNPKVQLLALTLLETIIKNCSDIVHMHVADRDMPHEMARIVKKKPDFHVKEKILVLIDTWQEAFGGPRARYPQYYAAYQELLRHGVVFPKRPDRAAPIFTPPQTRALSSYHQSSISPSYRPKGKGSTDGCDLPTMSFSDMQNARGIMGVLLEMIDALDPENKEDIKQEVILDLVHQCRSYREKLVHLVNSTSDEDLLCEGLALNDDLQEVVAKYDAIAAGTAIRAKKTKTLQALVDIGNPADTNKDGRPSTNTNTSTQQLLLPAAPTSSGGNPQIDLLSGDFDTPASENSLALVPVSDQMANSAKEQNMFSLADMFSQSSDVSSNSSPRTPFDPFSANSAAQAYPSTSQASPYSNGPNIWLPQYEQSAYSQVGHLNHGSPHSQAAPDMTSHEQSFDGVHDEGLPPPPWEAQPIQGSKVNDIHTQPMESGFPGGAMYPQMIQSSMHPGMMQGHHAMYSSGFESNQHSAIYPSPMLPGVYSQQMQGGHQTNYAAYPQQLQGPHFYEQRPCYPSYTDMNDISQGMHGLSMQDSSTYTNASPSYQMPTSPYSQQPNRPSKPEDKLFGDLVNMAKSKQNKPTVG